MFIVHAPIFTILVMFASAAATFFLPLLAKKMHATKYVSQMSIDVAVGILGACAILSAISLIGSLFVWLGNIGPLGYDKYQW